MSDHDARPAIRINIESLQATLVRLERELRLEQAKLAELDHRAAAKKSSGVSEAAVALLRDTETVAVKEAEKAAKGTSPSPRSSAEAAAAKAITVVCIMCGGVEPPSVYASRGRERPRYEQDARFRGARQFNTCSGLEVASSRSRLVVGARLKHPSLRLVCAEEWFPHQSRVIDKLALALAKRRCVNLKELIESIEFVARTRKLLRQRGGGQRQESGGGGEGGVVVADLCCGHGLTGMLFALLEKSVETLKTVPNLFLF